MSTSGTPSTGVVDLDELEADTAASFDRLEGDGPTSASEGAADAGRRADAGSVPVKAMQSPQDYPRPTFDREL
ncbi:hypothetical protein E3T39_06035 [Cryobacterium suzukii]|uniref:Uncharacterized protein n=1 Tax=Cryobacterium suzukii TaxID=1259198 RepID=A0A4R9AI99_9MICO|nr:hypothetical protein [Cryobacterium suzukii]TFD61597.1 hypothetical protein E3T39_06035 [Cryobacterium suzukii]